MADRATIVARIDEAETALHRLAIGQSETSVSYEGKAVTYTRAMMGDLRAYLNDLKAQLAKIDGTSPPRRAIGVIFR